MPPENIRMYIPTMQMSTRQQELIDELKHCFAFLKDTYAHTFYTTATHTFWMLEARCSLYSVARPIPIVPTDADLREREAFWRDIHDVKVMLQQLYPDVYEETMQHLKAMTYLYHVFMIG